MALISRRLAAQLNNHFKSAIDEKTSMRKTLIVLGILISNSSIAGAYKCIDANGKTGYQSSPCATGQSAVQINFKTGEPVAKNRELDKEVLKRDQQKSQELIELELETKRLQLIAETKEETEQNQVLIKNNPKQFSAYAIPPYDPEKLPEWLKKFESRLPEIEKLRRFAAQKVLASGQCKRVEASELNIKSTLENLVFLVNCSTGQGLYFNEGELK